MRVKVDANVGVTNVKDDIKAMHIWLKTLDLIGRFSLKLNNSGGKYNNSFNADDGVNLLVGQTLANVLLLNGYTDVSKSLSVHSEAAAIEQTVDVEGRSYSQDLANKIVLKKYKKQKADDIIADMLSSISSEIGFTNPSSAPETSYLKGVDKYLSEAFREILEAVGYEGMVDNTKKWQMWTIGSKNSGVTLKAVKDATDNNILKLEKLKFDAFGLRSYILVRGKKIEDGWSEGNALHWKSKYTGNVISDLYDQTYVKRGVGLIKVVKGTEPGGNVSLFLDFPRYNYDYLPLDIFGSMNLTFWVQQRIAGYNDNMAAPFVRLKDTNGNQIEYHIGTTVKCNSWVKFACPIGPMSTSPPFNPIETNPATLEKWVQASGSGFNWRIVEIIIYCGGNTTTEEMWVDGLELPLNMIAIAQEASPKARYKPITRKDIYSQIELQSYANFVCSQYKNPSALIKVTIDGFAGIVSSQMKLLPGYNVVVNAPTDGINATYRILELHHWLEEDAFPGHDYVIELTLILSTLPIDTQYTSYSATPEIALFREINERLKSEEFSSREEADFLLGLPNALPGKRLWEDRGTAFPDSPEDMRRFYRTDLDIWFRYSETTGMWVPCDHSWLQRSNIPITLQGINLVPNYSFESDVDGDGKPDMWGFDTPNGGSVSRDTDAVHGTYSVKMVLKTGCNNWVASDYIPVGKQSFLYAAFSAKALVNTHSVIAEIYWYDKNKAYISSSGLSFNDASTYSSTWTQYKANPVQAPATARFFNILVWNNYIPQNDTYYYDYFQAVEELAPQTIRESSGTSFPSNPFDSQPFYRSDLGVNFRYQDGYGWIPHGGKGTYYPYLRHSTKSVGSFEGKEGYSETISGNGSVTWNVNYLELSTGSLSSGMQTIVSSRTENLDFSKYPKFRTKMQILSNYNVLAYVTVGRPSVAEGSFGFRYLNDHLYATWRGNSQHFQDLGTIDTQPHVLEAFAYSNRIEFYKDSTLVYTATSDLPAWAGFHYDNYLYIENSVAADKHLRCYGWQRTVEEG